VRAPAEVQVTYLSKWEALALSKWEALAGALDRLLSSGQNEGEAKANLCNSIADREIEPTAMIVDPLAELHDV
jgi:hypothetical protein